jgi:hypothetical protein
MKNPSNSINEARLQFLEASTGNVYAEGIAVETGNGVIFGGKSSERHGFSGADEALLPLTTNIKTTLKDELEKEFEIAAIAIAVAKGGRPNPESLRKLAAYIGTQDGQKVIVVHIDNSEQISRTQELKL